MIKTLGKAFYWKRLIDDGTYSTTTDLAHAFKVEPGWAAEVLRMTMLAPISWRRYSKDVSHAT